MNGIIEFFEDVYNESLFRMVEVGQDNFRIKITNNTPGADYARAFLRLDPTGLSTPINLNRSLNKKRYKWGEDYVSGNLHFSRNNDYNTFFIEKIYEETLFSLGSDYQDRVRNFFTDFVNELRTQVGFNQPNFVDYKEIVA